MSWDFLLVILRGLLRVYRFTMTQKDLKATKKSDDYWV